MRIRHFYRGVRAGVARPGIVSRILLELGCEVLETDDGGLESDEADLVWMTGNAAWFPIACRRLASLTRRPPLVVWMTEPLPPPRASALPPPRLSLREFAKILLRDPRANDVYTNFRRLLRLRDAGLPDVLAVCNAGWAEFLAERGITAHVVPIGSTPQHGRDLGLNRDIGCLFIGDMTPRRRRRALRELGRQGLSVTAVGSWTDPECWGEARTRLLNRAKILLNIQRHPGELGGDRMILGMVNRALVVSELVYDSSPFVPGRHFVSARLEEMPDILRRFLSDADARERIVEAAHEFVRKELTQLRSVQKLLDLCRPFVSCR